ncbi:hypothetical protein FIU94_02775 [Sulfitobacter sp. THAF37]|nr:hypothetical protein FIU94_02775 [Sulfitobacter sp. THAF37]
MRGERIARKSVWKGKADHTPQIPICDDAAEM